MTDVRVPKLNNNDAQYVLVEWVAKEGQRVRAGEPLAVLETSKAAEEIVAEAEGVLGHHLPEGADCEPGQVIARLSAAGEERRPPGGEPGGAPDEHRGEHGRDAPSAGPDAPGGQGGPVVTAPAQALMDELGIGPERVRGLGKKLIRRSDVEALASASRPATTAVPASASRPATRAVPASASGPTVLAPGPAGTAVPEATETAVPEVSGEAGQSTDVPLSRAQQRAAAVVELSHRTIPPAYTVMKVDVGAALSTGRALTRRLRTLVGLPELLVTAVGSLHGRFPMFFASPVDARTVRLPAAAHVGVTFDVGKGLVIPVVRDASTRGLADISRDLMTFRMSAMRGDLRESDLQGANIVVTLHNEPGVVLAVPIIFPGHACALSLAAPQQEVVPDGAGGFAVREVVYLGVAFDHRIVNGRDAVLFLDALRTALASPEALAAPAAAPASPASSATPAAPVTPASPAFPAFPAGEGVTA
ncbi:2-oxo acid dehydrogenase subunit E2 [Sphaerisporangium viridialbum]|uniref:2-oxo acid dehydrogenase subunit E2 n=1 Tax=Sphaerisporangium viridialbum TaxID=46189 RepID=UPI003C724AAC